jgi:hypothetical protein
MCVPAHARRQPRDAVAQRLEHRAEERILLEAITAAPAAHQLGHDARQIDRDAPPEQDVEVLERDRRHVRPLNRRQGGEIGRGWPPHADAREIGGEIVSIHTTAP